MSNNVTIMAVGGAGCKIMKIISASSISAGMRLLAVDTDTESLQESGLPPESCITAGAKWRNGKGCGGDANDGQRAMSSERHNLETVLAGTSMLIVIGGLGRGAATGGMPVIASVASKLKIPNLFLLTTPFAMEGHTRRRLAEKTIDEDLFEVADAVITLPNDLLFSTRPASTPIVEAYQISDTEVARTALALAGTLGAGNLLSSDLASVSRMLKRSKNVCGIGVGLCGQETAEEESLSKMIADVINSPLLGGVSRLHEADAVFFSLLGGPELSLGNAKNILEAIGKYAGEEAETVVAASTDPDWQGMTQLTVIAIDFDENFNNETIETEIKPKVRSKRKPASAEAEPAEGTQLLFQLDHNKGEMERTTPVIWNGEDLDEPTFKRRGISVDTGRIIN